MSIINVIKKRRSVRAYKSDPISDPILKKLKAALKWAPSACNKQPWRFILVTSSDDRKRVAEISKKHERTVGKRGTYVFLGHLALALVFLPPRLHRNGYGWNHRLVFEFAYRQCVAHLAV